MAQHSVLVVGGCGFIGYHIVRHFVQAPDFSAVSVLSRSAANSAHKVDGANYVAGDLGDHGSLRHILEDLRPNVIIHAASPSPVTGTPKEYQKIAVDGTKNLLDIAKDLPETRVLIYTSSSTMAKGREHLNLDESFPLADTDPKASAYARTKAAAEVMVLNANDPLPKADTGVDWSGHFCTGALRLPACYGTHDTMSIPGCLQALEKGQTNVQLGDGKNLWDFCSTENAGAAHVLLARALLAPRKDEDKIDGEAFHIHDGQPRPFWDYAKLVWKLAGHKKQGERITSLPVWFVSGLAVVLELLFWLFTFGQKRPQTLGKQQVEYACYTHTYNINKAKQRLGYVPMQDFEGELAKGVKWSLEHDGWREKLQRAGVGNS
ncbi:C-3 sterol dehydrogenase/C-4 decarboxylase family protein [Lophiotrema nucula]|uniref:C-3 sterol dehydrogenase/C-4 decarboxylase family protein n=1 Tax=Lophiotrema nucula TaxID=690887 RepID=A0A6A5ZR11_9PLEO|nr:C-3 sterol dehydrogenase/C-4 decarboxylase family protein [Lophiotrema nucula]